MHALRTYVSPQSVESVRALRRVSGEAARNEGASPREFSRAGTLVPHGFSAHPSQGTHALD